MSEEDLKRRIEYLEAKLKRKKRDEKERKQGHAALSERMSTPIWKSNKEWSMKFWSRYNLDGRKCNSMSFADANYAGDKILKFPAGLHPNNKLFMDVNKLPISEENKQMLLQYGRYEL